MSNQDQPGYSKGLPDLLSTTDVLQTLAISRRTLGRLVKRGVLPVVYVDRRPRFLPEDVWRFVRSRRE